ncbi:hypothetical protein ACGFZR_16165 [Streptomyces sp. NPDC048241]|uniref:hypothetical protein n=1 Tax=Streptomyces sp. NPDC048241 TaxID=3365521 RepID=UPI0037224A3D
MNSRPNRPAAPAGDVGGTARQSRRLRVWERRVRAAGLPALWAGRCAALSEPSRQAAAVRHTAATLAGLPRPYRFVFASLLGLFPVAVVLADPPALFRGAGRGRPRRVADRLSRVPGCAELLRTTSTLAMYGALDGPSPTPHREPR